MNLKLRQRVAAAANLFFKRFYLRNSFREFEPALVGATCVLIASMVEECTVKVDEILRLMESAGMTHVFAFSNSRFLTGS